MQTDKQDDMRTHLNPSICYLAYFTGIKSLPLLGMKGFVKSFGGLYSCEVHKCISQIAPIPTTINESQIKNITRYPKNDFKCRIWLCLG
jgi:hypothetical protein